jgi:hypothetical protein
VHFQIIPLSFGFARTRGLIEISSVRKQWNTTRSISSRLLTNIHIPPGKSCVVSRKRGH